MIQAMQEEAVKQEAAEWRRGGAKTCGGQAAGPLQGRPLWLRRPDWCGKE